MAWLDKIPLGLLILITAWMAIAPIVPELHLIEKIRMLGQGTLTKPLDIFFVPTNNTDRAAADPVLAPVWRKLNR